MQDLDFGELDLEKILDVPTIKVLMEDITRLTGMVTAILDLNGKVLVATGWQRICTQYHRVHPEMSRNCTESDLFLARHVSPGEHVTYKCRNQMWDVVTPLYIGGKHAGNIYSGQFFYDDEVVDVEQFRKQAQVCGLDEYDYLKAVEQVPRVSRERVTQLMDFLARFATFVSQLSLVNLKLVRSMAEQQRADAALRDSEARFRVLVDQAPVSIAINNQEGKIEYVNRRFEAAFGYTLNDVPDTATWFRVAYPDPAYRAKVVAEWQGLLEQETSNGGDIAPGEYEVTCKDGTSRTVEIFGAHVGSRVLVLLSDITERRRDEQERARLEHQLQQSQKMEAVGRLAGGIAHDFNNLLTVINGYSELLIGRLTSDNPVRPGLQQIRTAGERAAELTQQLLAFSRKQVTKPSILNINDVVREASHMLHRVIGEDVEMTCRLDSWLWNVRADSGQLQQVLMNLVVNARDVMPSGGALVIETRNLNVENPADAPLADMAPGAYVMMSVSDSGPGMSEEVKRHIFEPFFTTKEMGKGTGLGLSIVFGIVKQSGGYVCAESREGHGATLRVCLPRAVATAEESESANAAAEVQRGSETVLVVEDQQEVLQLACAILETHGYRVLGASNGEEALRKFASYPETIHAMITDVVMPRMNGWDLAAKITAERPEIRVLYMSGYIGQAPAAGVQTCEQVDYIQKPFSSTALLTALRKSLDRPRS